MAQHRKEIKRRMKSVSNTKKMTRAMEMTAAAKMRKAQAATFASREYSARAWKLLSDVIKTNPDFKHRLLETKSSVSSVLFIHITTDKGLCGSLNTLVNKQLLQFMKDRPSISFDVINIGLKGSNFAKKEQITSIASYFNWTDVSQSNDVHKVMQFVIEQYLLGTYDAVYLSYTDFETTLKQSPRIRRLLPFILTPDSELGHMQGEIKEKEETNHVTYTYEPDTKTLLLELIPRLLESQLYQAILESQASEHSSRMVAMKNATESAGDILYDLKLKFNKARQAGITQEIIEIMSTQSSIQ